MVGLNKNNIMTRKNNKQDKHKLINFFDLAVTDFSHLKVTGVLNYHKYKDMTNDDIQAFLSRDVAEMCRRFVSDEWQEEVSVLADYTILDSRYHTHGHLQARLTYKHFGGILNSVIERRE